MNNSLSEIQHRLFAIQDTGYRDFHSRLMPTVDNEKIIGVRIPQLRALAKEIAGSPLAEQFISCLPHRYYEEDNLHAFLIEHIKDYSRCIDALNIFLPYVNNWATCDSMSPKVFRKHLPELLIQIKLWISSDKAYTVRYGIGILMKYYLDDAFDPEYLNLVAEIHSDEYYVNMMRAWFFATALAKQYDETIVFIEDHKLDEWTRQRTIQKAVESYRISNQCKEYLRSLRKQ